MKNTTLALLARVLPSVGLGLLLSMAISGYAQVSFSALVSYAVGTNPGSTITADFNGDGIPDLAVANTGDVSVNDLGSVSILLGKGDGTFQSASDVAAGAFPTILLSGDFNGDGKIDLFVEGQSPNGTTLVPWNILFGHGDGTFGAPVQIALTNFTASIVAGDFNNDKKLDLVFIDLASGTLEEETGSGDGTFQPSQALGSFGSGQLLTADFNGDKNPDLALGAEAKVQVLFGNGDATFRPPVSVNLIGANLQELLAADVDLDGKADLLVRSTTTRRDPGCELICGSTTTYLLELNLSEGTGSFLPALEVASQATRSAYLQPKSGTDIGTFSVGDFDSDGKPDIGYVRSTYAAGKRTDFSLVVMGGSANGTFPVDLGTLSGVFLGSPIAADLNGDKLADLGPHPLTSSTIGVVLNTTQGFWLDVSASLGSIGPGGSATATISVNPQNGFGDVVSLTCTAPQLAGIRCSLSPSSVAPGANSTLTISTTGNSASSHSAAHSPHSEWLSALCLPLVAILFPGITFKSKKYGSRKYAGLAITGLLLVGTIFQAACSGAGHSGGSHSGAGGTSPGNYTITITGTSGTTTRSTTLKLTVQ